MFRTNVISEGILRVLDETDSYLGVCQIGALTSAKLGGEVTHKQLMIAINRLLHAGQLLELRHAKEYGHITSLYGLAEKEAVA